MWRARTAVVLGTVACVAALLAAGANAQKNDITGGIEGKVKKVDVDSKTPDDNNGPAEGTYLHDHR